MEGIVRAFLDHADTTAQQAGREFAWEEHYRLHRISASYRKWEIASLFRKSKMCRNKPEKVAGLVHQDRDVWTKDVTEFLARRDVGYDDNFEWVEEAGRDLA